jgi:hypothetical protein
MQAANTPSQTHVERPNGVSKPPAAGNAHAAYSPAITVQELGIEVLQDFDRRWAAQKQAVSGKSVRKARFVSLSSACRLLSHPIAFVF